MKLKTLILHFLILVFFLHPSFCRGTEIPAHSTSTKIEQIFKQSDYDNYLLPPEYRLRAGPGGGPGQAHGAPSSSRTPPASRLRRATTAPRIR